ncbi:hypothetical protein R83H12_00404 [Fibrobacteria bacterium R8-3-H12]
MVDMLKIFDISCFLARNNFTHAKLAEKLECSTSLVSVWASSEQTPSFDKCLKLIELGMTFEEMFGSELTNKAKVFLNESPKEPESEFNSKVGKAIIDLLNEGFFKLKKEV